MTSLEQFSHAIDAELLSRRERLHDEISRVGERISEAQEEVRAAAEHGDRSENAEWTTAMENVKLLTAQLASLRAKAEIYSSGFSGYKIRGKSICIGSAVRIREKETGKTFTVKIVPQGVGDAELGAVSEKTPVGSALLGHSHGDVVKVKAPGGNYEYEILEAI